MATLRSAAAPPAPAEAATAAPPNGKAFSSKDGWEATGETSVMSVLETRFGSETSHSLLLDDEKLHPCRGWIEHFVRKHLNTKRIIFDT